MNAVTVVELLQQYNECPQCGSGHIGNGQGELEIADSAFKRTCNCGWKVEVKEGQN